MPQAQKDPAFARRVEDAARSLQPYIRRTPLIESPILTHLLGTPVKLKLEFLQQTGSFKLRGAFLRLLSLSPEEKERGVATCSAGNHGWALAHAGRILRVKVSVYVPAETDPVKIRGIEAEGASVIRADSPGFDEAQKLALEDASRKGLAFVSAYEGETIRIANGSTLVREMLEESSGISSFVAPVGGGGLAAGLTLYLSALGRDFQLIACQHARSPALQLSMAKGRAVTELPPVETLAGGLEGGIGEENFEIIRPHMSRVSLHEEEDIHRAVCWFLESHRFLVEPSSAVVLAACLSGDVSLSGSVGVILTGRNVSLDNLKQILKCCGETEGSTA